jgi:YHS domain-containing protein
MILAVMIALLGYGCSSDTAENAHGAADVHTKDDGHDHGDDKGKAVEPAPGGAADSANSAGQASTEPVVYKENGKPTCVVMAGVSMSNVDDKKFQDYDGVRYYFCCDGCPEKFAADPAKYAKKPE